MRRTLTALGLENTTLLIRDADTGKESRRIGGEELTRVIELLNREIFTILEQDLYPVAPTIPLGIQARAAGYLAACGLGPIRRWPY